MTLSIKITKKVVSEKHYENEVFDVFVSQTTRFVFPNLCLNQPSQQTRNFPLTMVPKRFEFKERTCAMKMCMHFEHACNIRK